MDGVMLYFGVLLVASGVVLAVVKVMKTTSASHGHPKSYPIIGSLLAFANRKNRLNYLAELLRGSPTSTFVYHVPFSFGIRSHNIITGNPDVVRHILKDNFQNYQKGHAFTSVLGDLLGDGIFNADGSKWKYQRQVACHEFNTGSLRRFVKEVVDTELSLRLVPLLLQAATNDAVLDLQDVLDRFTFDNICKVAFGYDPEYLSLSLSESTFATSFNDAVMISSRRIRSIFPIQWKLKKRLGIQPERRLKQAVSRIRGFAIDIVRQKKKHMMLSTNPPQEDLLSRFLKSGHSDEQFVADIVISFVLAGKDTTSASLTWFFWLLSNNSRVERQLLKEIIATNSCKEYTTSDDGGFTSYEEAKEMVYAHACLSEAMRLYPAVPLNYKEAVQDDVLPDGTRVRRGEKVTYSAYAMGRLDKIWGEDWAEFRPERWLDKDKETYKWKFVVRDPYEFPVFHAGPRICLGKEMAFLQMKRLVAVIVKRFKVLPILEYGVEPIFLFGVTSKMKGGFPVRFEERGELT